MDENLLSTAPVADEFIVPRQRGFFAGLVASGAMTLEPSIMWRLRTRAQACQ